MSSDLHDRPADQLLQPGGHRVQPERRVRGGVAGRAAEMADQDQAAAPCRESSVKVGRALRMRRSSATPPSGDLRDVEVDADQHLSCPVTSRSRTVCLAMSHPLNMNATARNSA